MESRIKIRYRVMANKIHKRILVDDDCLLIYFRGDGCIKTSKKIIEIIEDC